MVAPDVYERRLRVMQLDVYAILVGFDFAHQMTHALPGILVDDRHAYRVRGLAVTLTFGNAHILELDKLSEVGFRLLAQPCQYFIRAHDHFIQPALNFGLNLRFCKVLRGNACQCGAVLASVICSARCLYTVPGLQVVFDKRFFFRSELGAFWRHKLRSPQAGL